MLVPGVGVVMAVWAQLSRSERGKEWGGEAVAAVVGRREEGGEGGGKWKCGLGRKMPCGSWRGGKIGLLTRLQLGMAICEKRSSDSPWFGAVFGLVSDA